MEDNTSYRGERPDQMSKQPVAGLMKRYANAAVQVAHREYRIKLTYSERSLVKVETILSNLYRHLPRTKSGRLAKSAARDVNLDQICKAFGAYVGEVMRRKWGGRWRINVKGGNAEVFLQVKDTSIYPISKIYRRLANGEEDNILYFYGFFNELVAGRLSLPDEIK